MTNNNIVHVLELCRSALINKIAEAKAIREEAETQRLEISRLQAENVKVVDPDAVQPFLDELANAVAEMYKEIDPPRRKEVSARAAFERYVDRPEDAGSLGAAMASRAKVEASDGAARLSRVAPKRERFWNRWPLTSIKRRNSPSIRDEP